MRSTGPVTSKAAGGPALRRPRRRSGLGGRPGVAVAVAEGVIAGSALSEGGAARWRTGATGPRSAAASGSLPPVSFFSASTLAVSGSDLEAGLEPSTLSPSPLPTSVSSTSGPSGIDLCGIAPGRVLFWRVLRLFRQLGLGDLRLGGIRLGRLGVLGSAVSGLAASGLARSSRRGLAALAQLLPRARLVEFVRRGLVASDGVSPIGPPLGVAGAPPGSAHCRGAEWSAVADLSLAASCAGPDRSCGQSGRAGPAGHRASPLPARHPCPASPGPASPETRVGRAIGNQIRGHTTPCRSRWYSVGAGSPAATTRRPSFKRPRGLLWQALQVPAKIWDGLLPASRLVTCACAAPAARQPTRSVTVAKLSGWLPHSENFSKLRKFAARGARPGYGGHLLADYAANGSAVVTHPRDCHIPEYTL